MSSYVQKWLFLVFVFTAGIAATTQNVLAITVCTGGITFAEFVESECNRGRYEWSNYYTIDYDRSWFDEATHEGKCDAKTYSLINDAYVGAYTVVASTQCFNSCDANDPNVTGYAQAIYPDYITGALVPECDDFCQYEDVGNDGDACQYTDTNLNGSIDDGEPFQCPRIYEPTGVSCNDTGGSDDSGHIPEVPPSQADPEVPYYDCTNVDCTGGSDDPPPPPDGGGDLPGGGSDDSGGDTTTPPVDDSGANPVGDGDTDGDGDIDIDCNPMSNPDCAFRGTGSASAICGSPPTCTGDPVQCAQLYQSYNVMCAILTTAENEKLEKEAQSAQASNTCSTAPSCDGDPIQCTIIRQLWENQCNLIDPDDDDLTGDPDFGRDLSDEGEGTEVDITEGLDDSGLGTGSCPPPISIDTTWASMSIDTAPLCSIAGWVRFFVIMFTLLWAAPFVVRSF